MQKGEEKLKDDALFDRYFKGNAEDFDAVALHYYDYIYAIRWMPPRKL